MFRCGFRRHPSTLDNPDRVTGSFVYSTLGLLRTGMAKHVKPPPRPTECAVCMDPFDSPASACVYSCRHLFCNVCTLVLARERRACPMCRGEMMPGACDHSWTEARRPSIDVLWCLCVFVKQKRQIISARMPPRKRLGIDLFCGLGGFSFGMRGAGIEPVGAVDSWATACDVYRSNFPCAEVICGDLGDARTRKLVVEKWGGVGLYAVCGGPPCQSFSTLNRLPGEYSEMPVVYARVAARLRPTVVVMEEVPRFAAVRGADGKLLIDKVRGVLERGGYRVGFRVLNASAFGVPQDRKRLLLVAVKKGAGGARLLPGAEEAFPVPRRPPVAIRDVIAPPYSGKPLGGDLAKKVAEMGSDRNPVGYNAVRLDRPSPTVTTRFNVASCWYVIRHRGKVYRFSMKDGLKLQSLPLGTKLSGGVNADARLIGNAVPPRLAEGVLRWVMGG